MAEEKKELKRCISNIYEIRDEMEQAIKNARKVAEDEQYLADYLNRDKRVRNRFKELIDGTKDEVTGYNNQADVLKEKVAYANAVLELYEKGRKPGATDADKATSLLVEQIVTTMCLMLSIVPTMTEQRIQNEKKKAEDEANAEKINKILEEENAKAEQ